MTNHDAPPSPWRAFADRLTAAQIAQIERYESGATAGTQSGWLLAEARDYAERNAVEAELFAHLPAPAGAVKVDTADHDGNGNWFRTFDGTAHQIGGVRVDIEGTQYPDGRIERRIEVTSADLPDGPVVTADQARQLATALIAAADEVERLG